MISWHTILVIVIFNYIITTVLTMLDCMVIGLCGSSTCESREVKRLLIFSIRAIIRLIPLTIISMIIMIIMLVANSFLYEGGAQ